MKKPSDAHLAAEPALNQAQDEKFVQTAKAEAPFHKHKDSLQYKAPAHNVKARAKLLRNHAKPVEALQGYDNLQSLKSQFPRELKQEAGLK